MRGMYLITPLPELWDIFDGAVKLHPVTDNGYSLSGLQTYLSVGDFEVACTRQEFWRTMNYFLYRINSRLRAKNK